MQISHSITTCTIRGWTKCVWQTAAICAYIFLSAGLSAGVAQAASTILYINSFHSGYQWSDGIERGIRDRLFVEDTNLTTFYMDTLHKKAPGDIKQVALEAKTVIDELKPDIVIVSDDYAAKEIIVPFYKDASTPFVFCGIDWDASIYGLPFSNASGMLESDHITSVVDLIKSYASGNRIGFLAIDALSGHRASVHYSEVIGREFDQVYLINSMQEWEQKLTLLQSEVDMMILGNPEGIEGWDAQRAQKIVLEKASIPIGSTDNWLAPLSLVTIAKVPEEQGWWAANKAIQVLNGESLSDVSVTKNKEGRLIANLKMAEKLKITFTQELIEIATLIGK